MRDSERLPSITASARAWQYDAFCRVSPRPMQAEDAAVRDALGRHAAEVRAHAPEQRARGGDRDLLLEHDVHQRREAGTPPPHRRQSVPRGKRGEVRVAARERAHAGRERRLRQRARQGGRGPLARAHAQARGFSRSLK